MKYSSPASLKELSRYLPFPIPILSGPARGLWWKNTSQTLNGYWLGTYEVAVQQALAKLLQPGDTFWDVGAQSGFFSLLASKRVGPDGKVYSLEPLPQNCQTLQQQRQLNQFPQWELLEAALWNHCDGIVLEESNAFTSTAKELTKQNSATTPSVSLQKLSEIWQAPNVVKVDIEGAEATAFHSLPASLLPDTTSYILEIHGAEAGSIMDQYARQNQLAWYDLGFNSIATPPEWGQCLLLPISH